MNIQDKEMLRDLVVESRDHLSAIEPDLLELEQKGSAVSDDLINRVFRAVHSIKGGFGFFGIEHVTKLSHAMENVMSRIRDKKLVISSPITDAMLVGVDKLRALIDDVDNAEQIAIDAEVARLQPFLEAKPAIESPMVKAVVSELDSQDSILSKHPDIDRNAMVEAIKNGKLLYQVTVNSRTDLTDKNLSPMSLFVKWETMGEILDVALDIDSIIGIAGSSKRELVYSIIYASVLEPDLISTGVEVPQEQVYTIETANIKAQIAEMSVKPVVTPVASAAIAAVPSSSPAMEDALRVKVGLLNNLMNLAGELVLSRNQLLQTMERRATEALGNDMKFNDFERQIEASCYKVMESAQNRTGDVSQSADIEVERLKKLFRDNLSFRLVDIPGMAAILQNIDMVTTQLQENIMQTRLQPISVVFSKFPRIIRDLAKKLKKEANLTIIGQEVELDKSIIELLSDPLTHLIRNSVDHGLETLEKRAASGKKPMGEIVLKAFHEGGKVNIVIEDDGAGVNLARVREKALENNLVTADQLKAMSDHEVMNLIMLPGFSTAEVVSDVSGRGVGMDVVKTNIEKLGGLVDVESTEGKGTRIIMKLPLTLAIIPSLLIAVAKKRFAIPQVAIDELVRVRVREVTEKIERIGSAEVMRLRGKLLPLVRLSTVLGLEPTFVNPKIGAQQPDKRSRWSDRRGKKRGDDELEPVQTEAEKQAEAADERRKQSPDRRAAVVNAVKIVVLKAGDNQFGLVVDDVFDSEEIVVKPLSSYFKSCQCYAGTTIMGDGSVAMILDPNGIAVLAALKFDDIENEAKREAERYVKEQTQDIRELLLCNNMGAEHFALDLSSIARVEKIAAQSVERVGAKEFYTRDGTSIRLVRLSDHLPVTAMSSELTEFYIIFPKLTGKQIGIVVGKVDDVVQQAITLDTQTVTAPGISGSAIINKSLTLVLDIPTIVTAAEAVV